MEKIDISQSVKTLEFGSKYEARIQRIFREFDIKTIRGFVPMARKGLGKGTRHGKKKHRGNRGCSGKVQSPVGNARVRNWTKYAGIGNSVQDEEEEAKWEQRRYEIAKEVFIHHRLVANSAVYEADELIRALRGMTRR